ncbi:hypothetical protein [Enterococcus rivorum]|uniref:hypothetical protein n=1 Tax=Enterococcus rivorum TaxID=762845 RepID=UPI003627A812
MTVGEKVGKEFILSGVSAIDPLDGELTSEITYDLFFVEDGTTSKVKKDPFDTSKPVFIQ